METCWYKWWLFVIKFYRSAKFTSAYLGSIQMNYTCIYFSMRHILVGDENEKKKKKKERKKERKKVRKRKKRGKKEKQEERKKKSWKKILNYKLSSKYHPFTYRQNNHFLFFLCGFSMWIKGLDWTPTICLIWVRLKMEVLISTCWPSESVS